MTLHHEAFEGILRSRGIPAKLDDLVTGSDSAYSELWDRGVSAPQFSRVPALHHYPRLHNHTGKSVLGEYLLATPSSQDLLDFHYHAVLNLVAASLGLMAMALGVVSYMRRRRHYRGLIEGLQDQNQGPLVCWRARSLGHSLK